MKDNNAPQRDTEYFDLPHIARGNLHVYPKKIEKNGMTVEKNLKWCQILLVQ